MPATSQAALKRKLLALEPPKSPKHIAAGKKAAQVRLEKTDKQMQAKEAGKLAKGVPRGGKGALAALQNIVTDNQQIARIRVKAIAGRNAEEAVKTLVRLMNGSIEGTPAAIRRLAALDILDLARAGKDDLNPADKPMEEMTIEELQSYINQQVNKLDELQEVELLPTDEPESSTDGNR